MVFTSRKSVSKYADETEVVIYLPLIVKLNEENHPNPRKIYLIQSYQRGDEDLVLDCQLARSQAIEWHHKKPA